MTTSNLTILQLRLKPFIFNFSCRYAQNSNFNKRVYTLFKHLERSYNFHLKIVNKFSTKMGETVRLVTFAKPVLYEKHRKVRIKKLLSLKIL